MSRVLSNFWKRGEIRMWMARAVSAQVDHLLQQKATGIVHSVFQQSFNLQFGKRLVHIGAFDNGLAPFGIGLDYADAQMLTKKMKMRQPVAWNKLKSEFIFSSGEILSLKHAAVKELSLSRMPYDRTILEVNLKAVANELLQEKWQTGIVQTDEEKKNLLSMMLSSQPSTESPSEFADLIALARGEKREASHVFDHWIGRGPGLTPSGDDMMTGLTAMLTVIKGSNLSFM